MNRIILIGNGFDLAHGLLTKYEDFINWYWGKWMKILRMCHERNISDGLCTFMLKSSEDTWHSFLWNRLSVINPPTSAEFIKYIFDAPETFEVAMGDLFRNIYKAIGEKKWVDIENEYYKELKKEGFNYPKKLNKELAIVKSKLIEYLREIQKTKINSSILNPDLKNILFASFKEKEIAVDARPKFISFIKNRYWGYLEGGDWEDISIGERLGYDKTEKSRQDLKRFLEAYGEQIEHMGIESVLDGNRIPEALLYPNRIMFLNFNYTNVADLYLPDEDEYWFPNNHIHGNLNNSDSIIFGYGDELDNSYQTLLRQENNEYLRNIKSIRYLESNNYRNMLQFIESAPYQIYILGHSCGISDRTLLNTLFEHKNCVSIKPYYYQKSDGTDNYLELVQNICRNFTDMKLMRDRVVNKTYCTPLPQNVLTRQSDITRYSHSNEEKYDI